MWCSFAFYYSGTFEYYGSFHCHTRRISVFQVFKSPEKIQIYDSKLDALAKWSQNQKSEAVQMFKLDSENR